MKELVFQKLWEIQEYRREKKRAPDHVTTKDLVTRIRMEISEALDQLEEEGRIERGETLNDNYYKIIQK